MVSGAVPLPATAFSSPPEALPTPNATPKATIADAECDEDLAGLHSLAPQDSISYPAARRPSSAPESCCWACCTDLVGPTVARLAVVVSGICRPSVRRGDRAERVDDLRVGPRVGRAQVPAAQSRGPRARRRRADRAARRPASVGRFARSSAALPRSAARGELPGHAAGPLRVLLARPDRERLAGGQLERVRDAVAARRAGAGHGRHALGRRAPRTAWPRRRAPAPRGPRSGTPAARPARARPTRGPRARRRAPRCSGSAAASSCSTPSAPCRTSRSTPPPAGAYTPASAIGSAGTSGADPARVQPSGTFRRRSAFSAASTGGPSVVGSSPPPPEPPTMKPTTAAIDARRDERDREHLEPPRFSFGGSTGSAGVLSDSGMTVACGSGSGSGSGCFGATGGGAAGGGACAAGFADSVGGSSVGGRGGRRRVVRLERRRVARNGLVLRRRRVGGRRRRRRGLGRRSRVGGRGRSGVGRRSGAPGAAAGGGRRRRVGRRRPSAAGRRRPARRSAAAARARRRSRTAVGDRRVVSRRRRHGRRRRRGRRADLGLGRSGRAGLRRRRVRAGGGAVSVGPVSGPALPHANDWNSSDTAGSAVVPSNGAGVSGFGVSTCAASCRRAAPSAASAGRAGR